MCIWFETHMPLLSAPGTKKNITCGVAVSNIFTGKSSIFEGIGTLAPFLFIEFTPSNIYTFMLSIVLINMRGMMRHDTRFTWLIGNHHILHHQYPQYNFGEYWLDKLFGTKYPNTHEYEFGVIYI